MPVIATPITTSSDTPGVQCSGQDTLGPRITQLYGVELPSKRRGILATQGQEAIVQFNLSNRNGDSLDLTGCGIITGDDESIIVKIREAITTSTRELHTVTGTVIDSTTGLVEVELPTDVSNDPGVYLFEAAVSSDGTYTSFSNQFYLWVDRGLFGDGRYPKGGPPSLDDIRLALRDNAPEENRLLDDFEFDLAEVCHSAVFSCRHWNESQPPIDVCYNTMTYPAKGKWLDAICGHLFIIAANRFRRNHLPYQAGGLAIDDQNKFMQYEQTGLRMLAEYREWVKQKKVAINCFAAITSTGSSYANYVFDSISGGV